MNLKVDMSTCRAAQPLPSCPDCGGMARPNVLMFGDWSFIGDRTEGQADNFQAWLRGSSGGAIAVVEIGAGSAVPTVRMQSERLLQAGAGLVRINPRESQGPEGTISLPMGGLDALKALREAMQ